MGAGENNLTTLETADDKIALPIRNTLYRGASLGTTITNAQATAINKGYFTNMYLGDYWTFTVAYNEGPYLTTNGSLTSMPSDQSTTTTTKTVNAVIVGFDYYHSTCSNNASHHVVVVLDSLFRAPMHNTSKVSGTITTAYKGTTMYTNTLPLIEAALLAGTPSLEGHIGTGKIKNYLPNSNVSGSTNVGYATSSEKITTDIFLPTEENIYGCPVRTESPRHYFSVDAVQFPGLALCGARTRYSSSYRYHGWLRDMISTSSFAYADSYGIVNTCSVATVYTVRPAICIC